MEQAFLEERHRMMDAERQRYEASQQQMQTMFTYIQGLGASVNYISTAANGAIASTTATSATDDLCTMSFLTPGLAITPVSMNLFACMRIQ